MVVMMTVVMMFAMYCCSGGECGATYCIAGDRVSGDDGGCSDGDDSNDNVSASYGFYICIIGVYDC